MDTELNNLENEVINIDKLLLENNINHNKISKKIYNIRKHILELTIKLQISNINITSNNAKRLDINKENLNTSDDYNSMILKSKHFDLMKFLTFINTIFLPLIVLIGHSSISFKYINSLSISKYIRWLLLLIIIIIIIIIINIGINF